MPNNPKHLQNLKPFKKGDERINKKGRPKKIPELDVLLNELLGTDSEPEKAKMQAIIQKLITKAANGDLKAIEIILNRVYGKETQRIQHETRMIPILNIDPLSDDPEIE